MVLGLRALFKRLTTPDEPERHRPIILTLPTAGINVSEHSAMAFAPVWACVRAISETLSTLPWQAFERMSDGGRQRIEGTPLSRVLRQPNPEMTSQNFRRVMQAWVLTWGNAYAEIVRDNRGDVQALLPITPERVSVKRDDSGALVYVVKNQDGETPIPSELMLHLKGLGYDGLTGYSVITMAREAISLGLAAESFGAALFGNGCFPSGIMKIASTMDAESLKNMKKEFKSVHRGSRRAFEPHFVDPSTDWTPIGVPPEDAQYIELRGFQAKDIARIYRVPAHKIGILDDATFSNIEQQNNEFAVDTILPWATNFEQEFDAKCVAERDRDRLFTKMNLDGLLRGDIASRYTAFATARQWGWMSVNDIRRKEDMNPIPNGDIYLEPMNMKEAGSTDDEQPPDDVKQQFDKYKGSARYVFREAASLILRKETKAVQRAATRYESAPDAFDAWLAKFYAERGEHREMVRTAFTAPSKSLAYLVTGNGALSESVSGAIGTLVDICSGRWIEDSTKAIVTVRNQGGDLAATLATWEVTRLPACVEYMTEQTVNAATLALSEVKHNGDTHTT